ncbi:hypothetical protein PoB_004009700 [Plakobranchus ocellatus]|uniref:Uncharacterized protein n=1 Tax=Plakobranchus ocellatus TaxID=259542 RepID=A0AAV4B377_9GAST|nr:hypothetical protein PoB_004009700 [Plakobranchus ocellatus]
MHSTLPQTFSCSRVLSNLQLKKNAHTAYKLKPSIGVTLQELRTWHSGHLGSSFIPRRTRFAFEGRRSYTNRTRKLSGAMCQISIYVSDLYAALSQLVECLVGIAELHSASAQSLLPV